MTLLLTVVAFQFLTQDKLPESAEMTVIDKYTLCAYSILCFAMFHVALIAEYDEEHKILDIVEVAISCTLSKNAQSVPEFQTDFKKTFFIYKYKRELYLKLLYKLHTVDKSHNDSY